jgi:hypothetical protein
MTATLVKTAVMHGLYVGFTGDSSRAQAMRLLLDEKRAAASQDAPGERGTAASTTAEQPTHDEAPPGSPAALRVRTGGA